MKSAHILRILGAFVCILTGASVAHGQSNYTILARFKTDDADPANAVLLTSLGVKVEWRSSYVEGLVVIHCPNANATNITTLLNASGQVRYAEQSTAAVAQAVPCNEGGHEDPVPTASNLYQYQWALENTGQTIATIPGTEQKDIRAAAAWAQYGLGSSNVTVAVIDQLGVQIGHPNLAGSLWTNPDEIANGLDDDGDGTIDDIHGISFGDPEITGKTWGDPSPGLTPGGDEDPAGDAHWSHGTACASIIFGKHDFGNAWGVAPGCKLLSVRLVSGIFGALDHDEVMARSVKAVEYFLRHHIRISEWSMQFNTNSNAFRDMAEAALQEGHMIVASAGNDAHNIEEIPFYPASYANSLANIIAVGAHNNCGWPAVYETGGGTSYGPHTVLISAPGWNNLACGRTWDGLKVFWFSGTSAAAPYVAGGIALLLSQNPSLTVDQVRTKLKISGRSEPSLAGSTISGKALDVKALLDP